MMMQDSDIKRVKAAQSLYNKPVLAVYDWLLLGLHCRFIWSCPSYHMLELYNRHVSANHLDVGIGTGYFLDHCKFPDTNPRLALMDLNRNCLEACSKRLTRYKPSIYQRNVLEPLDIDAPGFDSIGMMNLLHCLPGNMKSKGVVFSSLKGLLNPNGVIFGSTFLYDGVQRNPLATFTLYLTNRLGFMTNMEDDLEGLKATLGQHFAHSSVQAIGCVGLFVAS
jgi:SAM-dependent methyltransferase